MTINRLNFFRIAFLLLILQLSACVSSKKYEDIEYKMSVLTAEKLNSDQERVRLKEDIAILQRDTSNCGASYREIYKRYSDLVQSSSLTTSQLTDQLLKKREELEVNQGKLKVNQEKLKDKENELADKEKQLLAREQLVQELRASIQRKEAEQQQLFQSLQNALGGFSAEELIVERRGGRVYVSLSDKLLFKPGDIKVDPQGKMALAKVANVLNKNPKIDVIIEGHTDNVPIKTAVYKDNWDLSVYRATSIVRILTEEYGVSPLSIIASGRGEHYAIADNENVEGKAKNRRTEIILMPKLDEIYSIIQR